MAAITHAHDFVGRRSELKVLEQRYASPRSEMVPVYGRRRVGKTELLLRFASGKPAVLFMASDKLRTPQIADFLRAASEWLVATHLAESAPATWEAALRLVIATAPRQHKFLLVLDEFQGPRVQKYPQSISERKASRHALEEVRVPGQPDCGLGHIHRFLWRRTPP